MNPNPSAENREPDQAPRYLRVRELAMFRDVVFAPRNPVRGRYAGRHTSRQRGHCVEFNDYREYTPGDEVADIDWKAYGRTDRLYIKRFEHQTDMTVGLLIDASASMLYPRPRKLTGRDAVTGSGSWMHKLNAVRRKARIDHAFDNPCKYDHACLMAAAIAFLTVRQQDRVALAFARNGLHQPIEPRPGFLHLNHLLGHMESIEMRAKANLDRAIHDYARRLPGRSLMIVFSDLLEPREPILRALSAVTMRGGEAIVFHTRHADELNLPDLDEAVFVDSETGKRIRLNVSDIRSAYTQRLRRDNDAWHDALTSLGVDYQPVGTATHYHEAISDYLFTRAARA